MRFLLALFVLVANAVTAQITTVQQKALHAYVDYANESAKEIASVQSAIINYYEALQRKNKMIPPRFVCPVQPEEYYYNKAALDGKTLNSPALIQALNSLRSVAESVDRKCKELDTYHKLEDYKQDNYAKAESIIREFPALLDDYRRKQTDLQSALETVFKKIAGNQSASYSKADAMMRREVTRERALLDLWKFNLQENVHTGWPAEKLEQSIPETDAKVAELKKTSITLQYPASSMWNSFQGSLATYLEQKRRSVDEYNFEAKKSDRHSNQVYLDLINYFNGTLVSDYNTFISFSERDNYRGLKMIQYVPVFDIRANVESVPVSVKPFTDIPRTAPALVQQKTPITKPVYAALTNYIDYINETWRQVRYITMVMRSFNSSAAYYRTLESYEKHGGLSFDYKDYQIPRSYLQKAVTDSKTLPSAIAKSLNDQSEVLVNILKEIDDLSASIETEVKEKRYEKDHLDKIYTYLERLRDLIGIWDDRKEQLYKDVRAVYEAYPPAVLNNSWFVSGTSLLALTDLDREGLFKAKAYYKGDSSIKISTEKIDQTLREVIAKEYDNMKGIEKYGRNNGLCPYTPYEDLPQTSKTLSEKLQHPKPAKATGYRHPYEDYVYLYNDIVEDYNKFCELSKDVLLLGMVFQPEIFVVKYPEKTKTENTANVQQVRPKSDQGQQSSIGVSNEVKQTQAKSTTKIVHDTVFIEKRDTVYLSEDDGNLRSMEGYATNNLVLLLDVSGSMNQPEKLPVLKQSVLSMLSMMRQEDQVSIVVFSGKAKVLLPPSSFKEEAKIRKAIDNLTSSGKTDGNAGLKLAYKTADNNYIRGGNNRIILATDGEFPVSDETQQMVQDFSGRDIFLSVFNFGKGTGSSKTLQQLASLGKGNYEHISRENVDLKLIREAKGKKKK